MKQNEQPRLTPGFATRLYVTSNYADNKLDGLINKHLCRRIKNKLPNTIFETWRSLRNNVYRDNQSQL
jgi:hypothetical protein